MKRNNNKGFTLAELLIVVAVIAVLVAVAIPTFTGQLEKSRQSVDVSNMRAAYAQAKLLVINQDDANSPFKDALAKVKTGQPLTEDDKTVFFWYNKDTNSLDKESALDEKVFGNDGKLSQTADEAENYRVGKALTTKLIANIDDFAEKSHLKYTGGTGDGVTLPTVNKGILVKITYDDNSSNTATYQTFKLDTITFSDEKQSTAGTIKSIKVAAVEGKELPTKILQGQKIDTTVLKVTATYTDESEVEITDYKFGYSNVATRKKVSQLINSDDLIPNTAVIPENVPVGCYIYVVTADGKTMEILNNSAQVVRTIKSIEKVGTVTVNTTEKTITGTNSGTGATEGLFKVTYTSGDPVYVKADAQGTEADKYSYKLSFDAGITEPRDDGFDVFTSGTTELLTAYNVYVYYKDSEDNEKVLNLGKVSTLTS